MTAGLSLPRAVFYFGSILIVQSCWTITTSEGNECDTATLLHLNKRNKACQTFNSSKNGISTEQCNKIKCNPFYGGSRSHQRCSCWCDLLASCFDPDKKNALWTSMCSSKFRRIARFETVPLEGVKIEIVPCRPFRKGVYIIKASPASEGDLSFLLFTPTSTTTSFGANNAGRLFDKAMMKFFTSISGIELEQKTALQDAVLVFETVIQEFKNASFDSQQMNITDDQKQEKTFFTTLAFEDFFVRFAQEQFNSTFSEFLANDSSKVDVRVKRVFHQNESEFCFNETRGENFIKIPSANLHNNDSVVLGVAYKNLHELLITNHSANNNTTNKTSRTLNTIIMSAVIYPPPEELTKNVTLVFKNIKPAGKKRECVFWDLSEDNPEGWSGKGCQTTKITESQTECVCNHLTHFAVLMDFTDSSDSDPGRDPDSEDDDKILTILTQVGLALSLTGVVLTIISYLLLTDYRAPLCHIRVSLTTCIGAGHVIFLAGIDATQNKGACVAVAALMQYFLMAAFCWMLVEGIYLYLFVVKVYNIADKIRIYHAISWGLPAIIVVISLSIAAGNDGIQSFVNEKYCWISSTDNLIWIFVSFVGLIELINLIILVRVIKEMTAIQQVKDNQTEQIRLGIRACVVLVPLLGVSWLFGFLSPLHIAFAYIFVILNSTQGFSIFVFHCLRNSEIRERFKRRIQTVFPLAVSQTDLDKRIPKANQSRDDPVTDPHSICEVGV